MASRYWIKLYHEILDDPKMGRLSDALFRRAIELFLIAGDVNLQGLLPSPADIAWRLRVPEGELESQMQALRAVGILSLEPDGQWIVAHFKDRQSADPPSRRMHRYREALQRHGSRYDLVTKRNTDVDIDKEAEEEKETDEDAEEENAGGSCSPLDELARTFIDHTGIPVNTGGEGKWASALARLREAGVDKADIVSALGECAGKGIVIANLGSIVNPAIISMARRKAGKAASDQEDAARYLKGNYAYLLRHE